MANTSVDLGNHFAGFVQHLKESGRYRNASEAIRAGLRLLEQEEAENQAKIVWLRQELIAGEESGDSPLTHAQIIAQAKTELHAQ